MDKLSGKMPPRSMRLGRGTQLKLMRQAFLNMRMLTLNFQIGGSNFSLTAFPLQIPNDKLPEEVLFWAPYENFMRQLPTDRTTLNISKLKSGQQKVMQKIGTVVNPYTESDAQPMAPLGRDFFTPLDPGQIQILSKKKVQISVTTGQKEDASKPDSSISFNIIIERSTSSIRGKSSYYLTIQDNSGTILGRQEFPWDGVSLIALSRQLPHETRDYRELQLITFC